MTQDQTTSAHQAAYNTYLDGKFENRILSARTILPLLMDTFSPSSVLDVGCGHGAWLQVAKELGVSTIQGVDGPWIDTEALAIPQQFFRSHTLEQPLDFGRTFDLVISLEVAEHIPKTAADTFVDNLVNHGDIILFSAAIPYQGGHGHVNEQWPRYWAEKFRARGYQVLDAIRPIIWADENVFWWLRQNTLLFLKQEVFDQHPYLSEETVENLDSLAIVHPNLFIRWVDIASKAPRQ